MAQEFNSQDSKREFWRYSSKPISVEGGEA